jgi:hypothetical protein
MNASNILPEDIQPHHELNLPAAPDCADTVGPFNVCVEVFWRGGWARAHVGLTKDEATVWIAECERHGERARIAPR